MKIRPVTLSVDWDAFFRIPETWVGASDAVWHVEAAWRSARGQDPRALFAPPPKQGPHPGSFWDTLAGLGYNLSGAEVLVADSHEPAFEYMMSLPSRPSNRLVLHVDSHHDMGYMDTAESEVDVTEGNWLFHALTRRKNWEATLVYPQWVGYSELDARYWHWRGAFRKRVVPEVWGAAALKAPKGTKVEGIFISRSNEWAPPWCDVDFNAFVTGAEWATGTKAAVKVGDPLTPRAFAWDLVKRQSDRMQEEHHADV